MNPRVFLLVWRLKWARPRAMKMTSVVRCGSPLSLLALLVSGLAAAAPIKVGLVLDKGGKDDKSFNAAAYKGAQEAEKKLGIQLKVVEATDDNAFETLHRSLAQKQFDLVIGVGISQLEAVKKVAAAFPDRPTSPRCRAALGSRYP